MKLLWPIPSLKELSLIHAVCKGEHDFFSSIFALLIGYEKESSVQKMPTKNSNE
jgi:hypothetical protein